MEVSSAWLDYGALGLLALVLLGVGWGLKTILFRWLNQVEAAIRVQEASAAAMTAMAAAMTALATSVLQHAEATKIEHRAIILAVAKKPAARPKSRVAP